MYGIELGLLKVDSTKYYYRGIVDPMSSFRASELTWKEWRCNAALLLMTSGCDLSVTPDLMLSYETRPP